MKMTPYNEQGKYSGVSFASYLFPSNRPKNWGKKKKNAKSSERDGKIKDEIRTIVIIKPRKNKRLHLPISLLWCSELKNLLFAFESHLNICLFFVLFFNSVCFSSTRSKGIFHSFLAGILTRRNIIQVLNQQKNTLKSMYIERRKYCSFYL